MKPKENFLEDLLIVKESDNPEENAKIFPLGYTDKREVKRKKKKHGRKSRHSSKSSSSESIEEKNEDLEEDNFNFIENNSDPVKKNELLINDDSDSDSEIIEEEIITEETIAKIYAEQAEQNLLEKNLIDINTDITPISETVIVKKNNSNNDDDKNKVNDNNIIVKEKKRRILKYKDNLLFKYFNHKSLIAKMRIITLIILLIYIALILISIFSYGLIKEKLTLFCFEFIENEEKNINKEKYIRKLFLSDRNAVITVQALCGIPFISIIIALLKNEYLPLKQFFKETSFYFPLTMITNIPIFIIGLTHDTYENKDGSIGLLLPIIFTVLTLIGFLSMTFILLTARERKYKSISNLINISILCSFMSSFEFYCFLYNVCLVIRAVYNEPMYIPEIIMGIIYFLFGIFIIISFKDIFYVFILVVIELGLLYIKKKNIVVTIINLCITFFGFAAITINIFKYKKKVFGFLSKDL